MTPRCDDTKIAQTMTSRTEYPMMTFQSILKRNMSFNLMAFDLRVSGSPSLCAFVYWGIHELDIEYTFLLSPPQGYRWASLASRRCYIVKTI